MRRLLPVLLALLTCSALVSAQQIQTVRVLDPTTKANVDVGDAVNTAIRVTVQGTTTTPIQMQSNSVDVASETTAGQIVDRLDTLLASLATEAHASDPYKPDGPQLYTRGSAATPSTTGIVDDDAVALWADLFGRLHIAPEGTQATAVTATGVFAMAEAKNIDGAAPPNSVTEGQATRLSTTLGGALIVTLVNEAGTFDIGGADDAHAVEDTPELTDRTLMMIGAIRRDVAASSSVNNGDNSTVNVDPLGRLWTRPGDPCSDHARITSAAIDTAASGNVQIVALNGADLIYICAIDVVVDAAVDVQLIYGTGTACATGETDLTGPWGFAANGGLIKGKGVGPYYAVPAGNAFCIETSGAVQTSGSVTYVRTAAP